jgi:hypothetical protein
MFCFRARATVVAAFVVSALGTVSAGLAAPSASQVISYDRAVGNPTFGNPSAALGLPDGVTGENPLVTNYFGFPAIISPFSPAYQGDEIVQIGEAGHLTLRLSHFAIPGDGPEIGLFSNAGLIDMDYPNGKNSSPAAIFSPRRAITVQVSEEGIQFIPLAAPVRLDNPTLYYVNAGPFDASPPLNPVLTDFGLPIAGGLEKFDGRDWAGTVQAFDYSPGQYSGGGNWIDISGLGLARVGYIRLSLPENLDEAIDVFNIDAVSVSSLSAGPPVPEPTCLALAAAMALAMRRRVR